MGMVKGEVSLDSVYQSPSRFGPVKATKINVNDKVSVEMTYGEVAMLYAIVGKTREDTLLWKKLIDIVGDTGHKLFSKFIAIKSLKDAINYHEYADQWVELLFPSKSDKQIVLDKKLARLNLMMKNAQEQVDMTKSEIAVLEREL